MSPKLMIYNYMVLDVGDIYLIWKNFTFKIVTPEPIITTIWWTEPTTTIIAPSSVEPEMTSSLTEITTTEAPPKRWVLAIFDYQLLNFRHYKELDDKNSELFQIYQQKFCSDIARFYRNSFLYPSYRDCIIAGFTSHGNTFPNITFHIAFETPVFPRLQYHIIRILESQAPQINMSSYTVMDVGDLYLIWKKFQFILVTPEPSVTTIWWMPSSTVVPTSTKVAMETSTVEMTSSIVVTTPDPSRGWLLAIFEYGLLNFRHYPELDNRTSKLFQLYERRFCEEIKSYYLNSFLYAAYRRCHIKMFGNHPNTIAFRIYFEPPFFPTLQSYILFVLETQSPKLNISTYTVMDVGDLYLIWKNFTFKLVTPDPDITTLIWTEPSTTLISSIQPSTPQIEATSTVVPTTPPPYLDWVLAIFKYNLFDFTFLGDLTNRTSPLFKIYQQNFCDDIHRFYERTYLGVAYKDCQIIRLGRDETIKFHIGFHTPLFPTLQADILRFLETSAPKLNISTFTVMDVGDFYLIWRNFTYYIVTPEPDVSTIHWTMPTTTVVSTTIQPSTPTVVETSTMITTTPNPELDWVLAVFKFNLLNFDYYDTLNDTDSWLFDIYERKFCFDIHNFYKNDYLSYAYRSCKIQAFGKNTIKFYIAFETPVFPTLMDDILKVLDTRAPKLIISDYIVLNIGDLFLIWDNFTYEIIPPQIMSTTLTWTRTVYSTVESSIEPTQTSVPMASSSRVPGIEEWVLAIFKFGLLEFFYVPPLANKDSTLFHKYQKKFCADISRFYAISYLSEAYRDCQITEFNEHPDAVKFFIAFETGLFPELQGDILQILESQAPKSNISGYTVLNIGDLHLIWSNFDYWLKPPEKFSTVYRWTSTPVVESTETVTFSTPMPTTTEFIYEIKLKFKVLNIRYTFDLKNINSLTFRRHQQLSCDDISALLLAQPKKYAGFKGCRIDKFQPEPLRVYFSLVFSDQQADETSQRVEALLVEVADRENFYDMVALQVGDLVIAVENFTVHHNGTLNISVTTPAVKYDAILYNYTFYIYERNFTDELQDESSQIYRTVTDSFCLGIKNYYMASYLNERYFSCNVKSFGNRLNPYMNVDVVFDGTYDYGSSIVFDVVNVSAPAFNVGGIRMIRVGSLLVYAKHPGTGILIRWSDVTTSAPPVTEFPVLYTQFDVSVVVLNLTYSWELGDRTSSRFRVIASDFCQQMDVIFSPKFPNYFGCVVQAFTPSLVSIVYSLRFRGIQDSKMEKLVSGLLYDNGWNFVGGSFEFALGRLKLEPTSIEIKTYIVRNGEVITQTTVPTTPGAVSTPATTPAGSNPCHPNKSGFVRHPVECDSFFVCDSGSVVNKMQCGSGQIFKGFMCGPRPPGFICIPSN
ncbi:uncharacterized protein LOC121376370 [Gigantopelta aegis]|uniref:uncharacterized protein LOC121376370 n=1 Tax=Gigantopelta aegis TaxID=1735272 RepID=UPI001B889DA3|nr:uncharacterized protein LOC121376370 [Gigantopelta aegis]